MRAWSFAVLCAPILAGCEIHEFKSVKVLAASAAYPMSMSEYMVVDTRVVHRGAFNVVGQLHYVTPCVKPDETTDISRAVNEQVKAKSGEGVVGLVVIVDATPSCQTVEFVGEIVARRREAP